MAMNGDDDDTNDDADDDADDDGNDDDDKTRLFWCAGVITRLIR
jgi:hypothetical protein